MKWTIFKCRVQWHLVHWRCCATTDYIPVQNLFLTLKENPIYEAGMLYSPTPRLCNSRSAFCLHGFASSGHFIQMELYNMWPFVSDVFHLASCFLEVHPHYKSVRCSFPWLNNMPLHVHSTFCFPIHLLMAFVSWLSQVMALWIFECLLSIIWGVSPRSGTMRSVGNSMFKDFEEPQSSVSSVFNKSVHVTTLTKTL